MPLSRGPEDHCQPGPKPLGGKPWRVRLLGSGCHRGRSRALAAHGQAAVFVQGRRFIGRGTPHVTPRRCAASSPLGRPTGWRHSRTHKHSRHARASTHAGQAPPSAASPPQAPRRRCTTRAAALYLPWMMGGRTYFWSRRSTRQSTQYEPLRPVQSCSPAFVSYRFQRLKTGNCNAIGPTGPLRSVFLCENADGRGSSAASSPTRLHPVRNVTSRCKHGRF